MRVMTYNVHSCIDMDKRNSLDRVRQFIKKERPAIVGLNEVESFSPRTRFANQPKRLAADRDLLYVSGPTYRLGPVGFFGNAILTRYPICKTTNFSLPTSKEPRCCLKASIRSHKGYITVLSTHLGLRREERANQIAVIAGIIKREKDPVILMGDFNCKPGELEPIFEFLTDTGALFGSQNTYPYDNPTERIDYVMVSDEFQCKYLTIPYCDASDHLPVIVELI